MRNYKAEYKTEYGTFKVTPSMKKYLKQLENGGMEITNGNAIHTIRKMVWMGLVKRTGLFVELV